MKIARLNRRSLLLATPFLLIPSTLRAAAKPTPRGSEGPFYPRRRPKDDDADLVLVENAVREAGGDILHLAGRLLDTNARPIAAARVEIWQCDVKGIYLHPGDRRYGSRDTGFQGFGHAITDADGGFKFRTIVPVPYPGRTPHIHVKVVVGGRDVLITQLYLADHPQNSGDYLFRRLGPDGQRRVSMQIKSGAASKRPTFETSIDLVIGG